MHLKSIIHIQADIKIKHRNKYCICSDLKDTVIFSLMFCRQMVYVYTVIFKSFCTL